MDFSRWFRRSRRPIAKTYRPSFCLLEDRTVPSVTKVVHTPPTPAPTPPVTHFFVKVPQFAYAGTQFDVEVDAESANNKVASSYAGTVHLSLLVTDAGATLPSDYTFTSSDHGKHKFQLTLTTAVSQTISAADTTSKSIAGSATTTVVAAPVATQLIVKTPAEVIVGVPTYVTVEARDASGHLVPSYNGVVTFSSNLDATLPTSYTFSPSDNGKHKFLVTFNAAGAETLSATGVTTTTSLSSQSSLTVDPVGTATHFGVYVIGLYSPLMTPMVQTAAGQAIANGIAVPNIAIPPFWQGVLLGAPASVIVVALDANNHVVSGYNGTVHLGSGDGSAVLPADYLFQASDNGVHVFAVTFNTEGLQTLTVSDTPANAVMGGASVYVYQWPSFKPPVPMPMPMPPIDVGKTTVSATTKKVK